MTIVLVVLSLLTNVPKLGTILVDNFALIPSSTLAQSKLWNPITASFLQVNLLTAIPNLSLFFVTARWIELSWGSRPTLWYLLLVPALAAFPTYLLLMACYLLTRRDSFYFTPTASTAPLLLPLLLAIKQLIPDHRIGTSPFSLSVNSMPLLYLLFLLFLTMLSIIPPGVFLFSLLSFHIAYVYLRFFRRNNNPPTSPTATDTTTTTIGDASDMFAYHTLFPVPLRPAVSLLSNLVFHVCRPVLSAFAPQAHPPVAPAVLSDLPAPSKASALDTERRRQRALKVLDERLQAATPATAVVPAPVDATPSDSATPAVPASPDLPV